MQAGFFLLSTVGIEKSYFIEMKKEARLPGVRVSNLKKGSRVEG
jgi:hypothetical protein